MIWRCIFIIINDTLILKLKEYINFFAKFSEENFIKGSSTFYKHELSNTVYLNFLEAINIFRVTGIGGPFF